MIRRVWPGALGVLLWLALGPVAGLAETSRYDPLIGAIARQFGLEPALLKAVIRCESGFDPRAVSPRGAQGLMQLMPATQALLGVTDAFEPTANIAAGARYLTMLRQTFGRRDALVIAAYNAGPQAVLEAGYAIPPFAETRRYVACVQTTQRRYRQRGFNDAAGVSGHRPLPVSALRVSHIVRRDGARLTVRLEARNASPDVLRGDVMLTYPEPLVTFVALHTSEHDTTARLPTRSDAEHRTLAWDPRAYQFLRASWAVWKPGESRQAVLTLVPRRPRDLVLHVSILGYDATRQRGVRHRWSTVLRFPIGTGTW